MITSFLGKDKDNLDGRVRWVDTVHEKVSSILFSSTIFVKMTEQIEKTVHEPHSYNWWLTADSPWQFLACAYEYIDACNCPSGTEVIVFICQP
jgi:DNA-directed RNA polymerase